MRQKALLAVISTLILAWAVWSGILSVGFEKKGDSKSQAVLIFDNRSKGAVSVQKVLHRAGGLTAPLGGASFVHRCKENPVLFGGLFIFFGVSACGVAFVVHMIRTDARF
jgi:hypothetical protein